MHIVFLSHEYPVWSPGGVGSFLQTFGRALVKSGHDVKVVGIGKSVNEEVLEDSGVSLIRLPNKSGILPQFVYNARALNKKLHEIDSEQPIDIIESAEQGLALISRKFKAKRVVRLHGGHYFFAEAEKRGINWRKGLLERKSFGKADGFIAVSNYVKEYTEKYLSYHNKPIEVIGHPMDFDDAIEITSKANNKLLFAGTVCEKKGVKQLIEAFKIVKGRYPEMQLDIYGRDWFFPDGGSYIQFLKRHFEEDYFEGVVFHGSVAREELFHHYAEATLCVFPSHMETQGLVALEAMMMGQVVIFSKYGPGPETINHQHDGLLCDVYDPEDIAEKVFWCIENKEDAARLAKNAHETIKDRFDKNRILEKNLTFYKRLL